MNLLLAHAGNAPHLHPQDALGIVILAVALGIVILGARTKKR